MKNKTKNVIEFFTVLETILMEVNMRQELQCLYVNLMANMFLCHKMRENL